MTSMVRDATAPSITLVKHVPNFRIIPLQPLKTEAPAASRELGIRRLLRLRFKHGQKEKYKTCGSDCARRQESRAISRAHDDQPGERCPECRADASLAGTYH
jgi:hypothetical protein